MKPYKVKCKTEKGTRRSIEYLEAFSFKYSPLFNSWVYLSASNSLDLKTDMTDESCRRLGVCWRMRL